MSSYARGLLIAIIGILILTPDSATLNMVDADPFAVLFWRSCGLMLTMFSVAFIVHRKNLIRYFRALGWIGVASVPLLALTQICFVVGVQLTNPSHVLVMLAVVPLSGAIFSRLILAERIDLATLISIFAGMFGVTVMVLGSFGGGNLAGDIMAAGVPIFFGLWMVLNRLSKAGDTFLPHGISAIVTGIFCFYVADSLEIPSEDYFPMAANALIIATVPFMCIIVALRYVSAAEVGLVALLETLIGPLWVWLAIGVAPTFWAGVGGGILLVTLFFYGGYKIMLEQKKHR